MPAYVRASLDDVRVPKRHTHKTFWGNPQWRRCAAAGDIYLGDYEGWYNEREETFVTPTEAEANGYVDPSSGVPYKKVSEQSYFFRLSKYTGYLREMFSRTGAEAACVPEDRRKSILKMACLAQIQLNP